MAHKKGHKGVAPKGAQSEADRISALARAYGLDASGRNITSTGGAVTGGGYISPSEARHACYGSGNLTVLRLKRRFY
jgi:hypothetical protein